MAATQLSIETRADGSGTTVDIQTLHAGDTLTLYSIARNADNSFDSNVAVTSWALSSAHDDVVSADLVAALNLKSAVFTAHDDGDALITATATVTTLQTAVTATVYVIDRAIASMRDVQLYLGDASSTNEALFARWLKNISQSIEADIDQPVYTKAAEDILNGSGDSIQYLRTGRLISLVGTTPTLRLASLQQRGSTLASWENIVTDEALIFLNPNSAWRIELLDFIPFVYGFKNTRVAYYAGFDPVPDDLKTLCLEMIQMRFDESKKGSDLLGKISRNVGEGGTSQNLSLKDMNPRWNETIEAYMRHPYNLP